MYNRMASKAQMRHEVARDVRNRRYRVQRDTRKQPQAVLKEETKARYP